MSNSALENAITTLNAQIVSHLNQQIGSKLLKTV